MQQDRLATLVRLLEQKTREGVLFWEETKEEDTYQASLGEYAVRIFERTNPVDDKAQDVVRIGICDAAGKQLDAFTDLDIEAGMHDAYHRMASIYQMARRSALGIDRAVEHIIAHLESS